MKLSDFHFDLPDELIALKPAEQRRGSRLLCLDGPSGSLSDEQFPEVFNLLNAGDLLVFNNTRVIPARVFAKKETGGAVEVLVERVLSETEVLAHTRASKSPKPGSFILFDAEVPAKAEMVERVGALFKLRFDRPVIELLNEIGHMPLPPYIEREDDESDKERYQTVYGEKEGAVAAPTAGLHFDDEMLEALKKKGVRLAFVTLHVGAGTFQPVRVDNIKEHEMHSEWLEVSQEVVDLVNETKAAGGRVVAVGTTSVRSLESAAQSGSIKPMTGDTDIFIYPGKSFNVVDALITNFHLPESTLLMLISAFAGYNHTMAAYHHAVEQHYRFFSYGDAMFITRNPNSSASEVPNA